MPGANGNTPKAFNGGTWKDWNAVQGNLAGTWRLASDVFIRRNDVWTKVWVRLTAPTAGSSSISHVTATISWTAGVGQEGFKLYRNGTFVKNVIGANTTTDEVPTMQADHVYTVSAYAGPTETEQIACGTVRAEVGSITSISSAITRNWQYIDDTWDNALLIFRTTWSAVSNATGYEWTIVNVTLGTTSTATTSALSQQFGASPNTTHRVTVRAIVNHNGVNYFSAISSTSTVNSGQPLIRTARTDNFSFEAWLDQERYTIPGFGVFDRFDTNYNAFGTIVDSYQFRNLDTNIGSQITSATRSIELEKPGTNVLLSGTPYVSNGYNSSVFTNYADDRYRVDLQGSGWFNFNSANKLTGTIRFNIRFISQPAVAPTIT
jgi:hypothetical protein